MTLACAYSTLMRGVMAHKSIFKSPPTTASEFLQNTIDATLGSIENGFVILSQAPLPHTRFTNVPSAV